VCLIKIILLQKGEQIECTMFIICIIWCCEITWRSANIHIGWRYLVSISRIISTSCWLATTKNTSGSTTNIKQQHVSAICIDHFEQSVRYRSTQLHVECILWQVTAVIAILVELFSYLSFLCMCSVTAAVKCIPISCNAWARARNDTRVNDLVMPLCI
jgi:hypothetical protein